MWIFTVAEICNSEERRFSHVSMEEFNYFMDPRLYRRNMGFNMVGIKKCFDFCKSRTSRRTEAF